MKGRGAGGVFPAVRNSGTFLIRRPESWHTNWKAGQVQFCQGWAFHYPWEKLPKFGKFTGLWKISLCTFLAVALVDTDAAALISVCLTTAAWAEPNWPVAPAWVSWEDVGASAPWTCCASPAAAHFSRKGRGIWLKNRIMLEKSGKAEGVD